MISRLSKFIKTSWFHHNKSKKVMNKKKGDDLSDKVLGFLLGLGAGTIVYGLLSLFQKNESKSFCPVCNTMIDRGISQCSKCREFTFSWR